MIRSHSPATNGDDDTTTTTRGRVNVSQRRHQAPDDDPLGVEVHRIA